jgi:hypothetical protein
MLLAIMIDNFLLSLVRMRIDFITDSHTLLLIKKGGKGCVLANDEIMDFMIDF